MIYHQKNNYNIVINYTLILYAFAIPISRAGISFFTALLILMWLFEGNFKEKLKEIKSNKITVALLIFVSFSLISLSWSSVPIDGLLYVRKYWYFAVIFIMLTSLDKQNIKHMINAFLLGMLISEILSYGIFFNFWEFKDKLPSDPTPFMNHLQYSMFLAFTALMLLNNFYSYSKIKIRFLYMIYFLFVVTNLFVNGGRTGQVAFILSIFILAFMHSKKKIQSSIVVSVLLAFGLFTAYNINPNFKNRVDLGVDNLVQISKKDYCNSFGLRAGAWIVGANIIKDNPIIGVGASDEMIALKQYIDNSHPDKQCVRGMVNFHNDFMHISVQLGLVGAFLYLFIFYSILKIKIDSNKFKRLPVTFISVYFISSMFENMFHQQFSMLLFTLFVGIFITLEKDSKIV
jgi:O-antigen ligase